MTHTLHRMRGSDHGPDDIVILCMAAQGINNEGAGPKLAEAFRILMRHGPVNAGDDNRGGLLTGLDASGIVEGTTDKSYIGAVFDDRERAKKALQEMKKADLGLSVVVTGDREKVIRMLREVGLGPHTVNLSLGTMGAVERLPKPEVLEIVSMCGHGMVCAQHVEQLINRVWQGKVTPDKAALELAHNCTCAVFNPKRAAYLIAAAADLPTRGDDK